MLLKNQLQTVFTARPQMVQGRSIFFFFNIKVAHVQRSWGTDDHADLTSEGAVELLSLQVVFAL